MRFLLGLAHRVLGTTPRVAPRVPPRFAPQVARGRGAPELAGLEEVSIHEAPVAGRMPAQAVSRPTERRQEAGTDRRAVSAERAPIEEGPGAPPWPDHAPTTAPQELAPLRATPRVPHGQPASPEPTVHSAPLPRPDTARPDPDPAERPAERPARRPLEAAPDEPAEPAERPARRPLAATPDEATSALQPAPEPKRELKPAAAAPAPEVTRESGRRPPGPEVRAVLEGLPAAGPPGNAAPPSPLPAEKPPSIHVQIGRIEVRAAPPPPPAPRPAPRPRPVPALSLADYLAGRKGGTS